MSDERPSEGSKRKIFAVKKDGCTRDLYPMVKFPIEQCHENSSRSPIDEVKFNSMIQQSMDVTNFRKVDVSVKEKMKQEVSDGAVKKVLKMTRCVRTTGILKNGFNFVKEAMRGKNGEAAKI